MILPHPQHRRRKSTGAVMTTVTNGPARFNFHLLYCSKAAAALLKKREELHQLVMEAPWTDRNL